jgi:hypothetical protein
LKISSHSIAEFKNNGHLIAKLHIATSHINSGATSPRHSHAGWAPHASPQRCQDNDEVRPIVSVHMKLSLCLSLSLADRQRGQLTLTSGCHGWPSIVHLEDPVQRDVMTRSPTTSQFSIKATPAAHDARMVSSTGGGLWLCCLIWRHTTARCSRKSPALKKKVCDKRVKFKQNDQGDLHENGSKSPHVFMASIRF